MISKSTINELKKQYGPEIYSVRIGKVDYAFRVLSYGEYKQFSKLGLSSADLEELIVNTATVYPTNLNLDDMLAGHVSSLADEILEYSSFTSIESTREKIEESRLEVMHGVEMMQAFIMAAMPQYTQEQLDTFTIKTLTDRLAKAELILDILAGVARGEELKLSLIDPNEQQEQPQKKVHNFSLEDLDKVNRNLDGATNIGAASINDPIAQKLKAAFGG